MICFQFSAVGLTLNGVNHANNSIVTRTDIGTGSTALLCTTTLPGCCSSSFPDTQWYFPDGSQVQNNGGLPYYRTRSRVSPSVLLHRNTQGTTTGIFRCDILDASGVLQRMFVGIYDSGTGESCTLSEWLVFCKEISCIQDLQPTTGCMFTLMVRHVYKPVNMISVRIQICMDTPSFTNLPIHST